MSKTSTELEKDLDDFSSKLSDSVRYMAFGLVAVAVGLLTTTTPFAVLMQSGFSSMLVLVAALGSLVIFLDALQMLLGYLRARMRLGSEGMDTRRARKGMLLVQEASFYLKLFAAFAGAMILVIGFVQQIGRLPAIVAT